MTTKIEGTSEAWGKGELGEDSKHAKRVDFDEAIIDSAMDLQMISIRMQKTLLEDLKKLASLNGIGYQPLMKQILKRFVDGEYKKIANECIVARQKEVQAEMEAEDKADLEEETHRKRA